MVEHFFEIKQLTYRYADGTTALNNLTLSIEKGKRIALLGKNGAGKSTLFQHLNGLLKPSSGTIFFNGQKLTYDRKFLLQLRKQVGIVFQDPDSQLFSGNVKQDISFGPMNLGWSKERIENQTEWAMELTEVTNLQDRPIHFLSLGQKKRVAIAGVLAMDPNIILLDEPTAGLDAYYTKKIKNILDDIHAVDKTMLLSTHDVQFAYEWADEIIVMNNGEILYHGDPVTIFHREDILNKSHIEKPWVFEIAQQLIAQKIFSGKQETPRNKESLFQKIMESQTSTIEK
ncbi:energy-coupling factor ABC transporter ATP-binding protein [Bacillus tuaregi]|uniref:energy-coupling factor ABC transporter ATP-binding protein n=1 Tax=Bacillus tuaregi TaxID=1816695 RepID=UPI0008F8B18A|nr:energy-coupling factor ABC transporter ATP-binding protein [Bacillus tuaregi]